MNIKCLLGLHDMKPIQVRHYYDNSYSRPGEDGLPSTSAVYKCTKCGKLKKLTHFGYGFLTLKQIS
jgi:hypothetical protein